MKIIALVLALFAAFATSAMAQPKTSPVKASVLTSYPLKGLPKPALLKLPNPLGWPDPLCVTDHPSASCASAATGGGTQITGDPEKDLVTIIQQGGIVYIRDLERADQYAAYPCDPTLSTYPGDCTQTKADALNSACLEAVTPLAKMIVLGPPTATGDGKSIASSSPTNTTASNTASTTAPPPAPATAMTPQQQLAAPLGPNDEALVTFLTKVRLVRLAFAGPVLKLGCSGLVQDEVNTVMNPAALVGLLTTGPLGPVASALAGG